LDGLILHFLPMEHICQFEIIRKHKIRISPTYRKWSQLLIPVEKYEAGSKVVIRRNAIFG